MLVLSVAGSHPVIRHTREKLIVLFDMSLLFPKIELPSSHQNVDQLTRRVADIKIRLSACLALRLCSYRYMPSSVPLLTPCQFVPVLPVR